MRYSSIINIIIVLLAFNLALTGCNKVFKDKDMKEKILVVSYDYAVKGTIQDKINVSGSIHPDEEVIISNKNQGKIVKLNFDLGDYVRKGQIIAQINPTDYDLIHKESLAKAQSIKTSLEGIDENIELHSHVRQAKANMDDAYSRMIRLEDLAKHKLVSQQDFDSAKAKYEAAKATYDNTITNIKKIKKDLETTLSSSNRTAQDLSDSNIISPISGYIQKRNVSLGEFLRVDTPIYTIIKTNPLKIKASLPERYALKIKKGQKVTFKVDAISEKEFVGFISRIAPAVNDQTRTLDIEITVDNKDNYLKPGLFALLTIDLGIQHEAIFVPETAVHSIAGINKVFTYDNGKVEEHQIEKGRIKDNKVEVISDITTGEIVITTDVDKLSNGLKVNLADKKD